MFTCIVYISHIFKHDQLLNRSGLDNMGPKRAQSFIRKFYIFISFFCKIETSEEGESQKASGKQIICTVNDKLSTYSLTPIISASFLDPVLPKRFFVRCYSPFPIFVLCSSLSRLVFRSVFQSMFQSVFHSIFRSGF